MDSTAIIFSISAAILSGMGTAIVSGIRENRREKTRQAEREHDHLKLELKDLKIQLYQVERDLTIWKDKYYNAIQELIGVKAELEDTLIKISLLNLEIKESE
jgi:sulfite reductase alpha subunit-like flavoprotein